MTPGTNWGARPDEMSARLPCDALLPGAGQRLHRAVSILAAPGLVYRWLCQLSVAPYSYDWIDNRGHRSPRELTPGADELHVGQSFLIILRLASWEHGRRLTLANRRTAVTYDVSAQDAGSRLYARMLFAPPGGRIGTHLLGPALALGDLVMMRRQLLTLRELAERDARRTG